MAQRGGAVHVVTTRRKYKGREYVTHLLRRSYRDGDKVKNETLSNLSHLPAEVSAHTRQALIAATKGELEKVRGMVWKPRLTSQSNKGIG